jgi:hypothetical protein
VGYERSSAATEFPTVPGLVEGGILAPVFSLSSAFFCCGTGLWDGRYIPFCLFIVFDYFCCQTGAEPSSAVDLETIYISLPSQLVSRLSTAGWVLPEHA